MDAARVGSKSRLAAVPTWEALAADPSLFDTLPRQAQAALYVKAATLEATLRAKILASGCRTEQMTPSALERALRIEEACPLLGMTKDFLYRNWKKLDLAGYRDDDGHVKFPLSAIQRHIRRKGGR